MPRFRDVEEERQVTPPIPEETPSRLGARFWSRSADPANGYFADGLTDELIRNLSIIDGMAVRSRTSSFGIKRRPRNIRDAGQQLQADYVLEGSVLRAGPQLRIVQLVRVHDDFPVWSGRFDRKLTDVSAVQP